MERLFNGAREFLIKKRLDWLELASVLYLAVPMVIFSFGWLRLRYAIPAVVFLLVATVLYFRRPGGSEDGSLGLSDKLSRFDIFKFVKLEIVAAVAIVWVLISGIGGFGFQTLDYDKHNALFNDLLNMPWPVTYTIDHVAKPLVYYVGYYLPSTFMARHFGLGLNEMLVFLWSLIGVGLALAWLYRFIGPNNKKIWPVVAFVVFSGLDIIGWLVYYHHLPSLYGPNLEWYNKLWIWQYSSNTTLLNWVPQHAIAGWVAVSLLINSIVSKLKTSSSFFVVALGLLMSPLMSIGLLPFALTAALKDLKHLGWRSLFRIRAKINWTFGDFLSIINLV